VVRLVDDLLEPIAGGGEDAGQRRAIQQEPMLDLGGHDDSLSR
jgi:hypothetical protein